MSGHSSQFTDHKKKPDMTPFKADLHIHTVLSPCGDLEMSPSAIVQRALARGLDMIAISDHNTTRQVKVAQKVGRDNGLFVLGGVEVTSQEEAHCLAYFETDDQLDEFQEFLDQHLPPIPNDEDRFGYQLIVDENEEIVGEEEYHLLNAIDVISLISMAISCSLANSCMSNIMTCNN